MTILADTERLAARRRPFEALDKRVCELALARADEDSAPLVEGLRYALNFAKLTSIENPDGSVEDVEGVLERHAKQTLSVLESTLQRASSVWDCAPVLPTVVSATRVVRRQLLSSHSIERDALEAEVTTRLLAVASGGGGGAGYVFPGAYEVFERNALVPDVMSGASIGSLMSIFRARFRNFDFARFVDASRKLAWSKVFRVFQSRARYGLPAALRLQLRSTLGSLFEHPEGRQMWLSDLQIPLYICVAGITVDALKHDLEYYEHLIEDDVQRLGMRASARGGFKAAAVLREFLTSQEGLVEVVLGRDPSTKHFDAIDAAGFSSSIPGIIHYDVLRDDARMHRILDSLYAHHGITRLGDGGIVCNLPSRVLWESCATGLHGRRNALVVGLDCFSPAPRRRALWYPFQQLVRAANVDRDLAFTDIYVPFPQTLSPVNLVPPLRDALTAMVWGREATRPHIPLIRRMLQPIEPLASRMDS